MTSAALTSILDSEMLASTGGLRVSETKDGTGRGLVEFFDYLSSKGLMKKATAGSRKTAAVKVLEIDEDWEEMDLRALDLDQQVQRFHTLRKGDYAPGSLGTYESRFRSAVSDYLAYLDNPSAFRPTVSASGRKAKKTARHASDAASVTDSAETEVRSVGSVPEPTPPPPRSAHITYPFPLSGGGMAHVQLPRELTAKDAERMARFLASLAIDSEANEG
jgi:hypothetical protein